MRSVAAVLVLTIFAVVAYAKPRPTLQPRLVEALPAQLATAGSGDTVWYGGTAWMPDSMRWEAIRDSVWTFDTGIGSSINTGQNPNKPAGYHQTMEGWFGIDQELTIHHYFRRSTTCAINGSYSAWAGVTQHEADSLCYVAGRGYGNRWDVYLIKSFAYSGSGNVTLSYAYAIDSEAAFDYAYAYIDTLGATDPTQAPQKIKLRTHTGLGSGGESLVLQQGVNLPSTAGPISIWFRARSDGSYSDEDGLYVSVCGFVAIDDIRLSGAITDTTDFESDLNRWSQYLPALGKGDHAHLAHLDDIPDPVGFGACGVRDSVLVFFDEMGAHPLDHGNVAVSPWIDLKRGGDVDLAGRIMAADLVADLPVAPRVHIQMKVRWYPYTCPGGVTTSPFMDEGIVYYFGEQPYCTGSVPFLRDFSSVIAPDAEQVQVAWGVRNFCRGGADENCTPVSNTTPYLDNIRFGVYGTPISDVPESPQSPSVQLSAHPNPLRTSTRISFTAPADGPAELTIYDVAGRRVRTLLDEAMLAGPHDVTWNATDDTGQRVATGLYFYRLTVGGFTVARKLVVIE